MKLTNKILIIALAIGFVFLTLFMIKVNSFVHIEKFEPSGVIENKVYKLDDFDKILVEDGVVLTINQGHSDSLSIEIDTAFSKYLEVQVEGSTLVIRSSNMLPNSLQAQANLQFVMLKGVSVNEKARVISEGKIIVEAIRIDASAGGEIKLNVDINDLEYHGTNGANTELSGEVNNLVAYVNHGANLNASKLRAKNVKAESSNGSTVSVFVEGTLSVNAMHGGVIKYKGNPVIEGMEVANGGAVTKL